LKEFSDHNLIRITGRDDFFFGRIMVCQKPPRKVAVHLSCTSSDVFLFFGNNGGVGVVGLRGCRYQADRGDKGQHDGIRRKFHRGWCAYFVVVVVVVVCREQKL